MTKHAYLLKLPELLGETVRLSQPCPVANEPDGNLVLLNPLDPRSYGRSFFAEVGPDLVWHARVTVKSLDQLSDLYGFHSGAIVSSRVKEIIESFHVPNVEFIPLIILFKNSKLVLGTWWFVNVFNWKRVFDFEKSKVSYSDFSEPVSGLAIISQKFGRRAISAWEDLHVRREETDDGLFLAEGPNLKIWSTVFISKGLAQGINDRLPKDRQISFSYFWCDRGPGPQFDLSAYQYAGK